ncbi:hypothetical protein PYW08_015232 [Mythimna loreyi]|uniref:Uncharacterized protein n=1 Tax=Mythimna loreyi TaxID=667449 RepID=A0ACC2QXQ2_9NEOP|nr:hypothetical protein PYW08_015232 [Mythimna loreyi]
MHRVLILVVLYMRLVHSWDIAISVGDRLEFYDSGIKTDTIQLTCSGYIYWTNIDKSPNKFMERARFNGAEKQLVNNYLPVFSFAIDSKTHKNYYISGFIHEFHNEVDVRNGNLYDDNSELIFSFLFQSEPRELTITEDYVYWMNSTVNYTTVWQRPKIAPRFVVPREICKFYSERPIGIAANYKIKDQVQDMESCKATSRLVPTAETAINSPNIEQKPQILEINQTTETEPITE